MAQWLQTLSMDEVVEAVLDLLETHLPYRHKGVPQQIVRDALQEAFQRGVSAGVDAERLIIKDALLDYFQRRDAAHRAGGLVNPDDRSDGSDTSHQLN